MQIKGEILTENDVKEITYDDMVLKEGKQKAETELEFVCAAKLNLEGRLRRMRQVRQDIERQIANDKGKTVHD